MLTEVQKRIIEHGMDQLKGILGVPPYFYLSRKELAQQCIQHTLSRTPHMLEAAVYGARYLFPELSIGDDGKVEVKQ